MAQYSEKARFLNAPERRARARVVRAAWVMFILIFMVLMFVGGFLIRGESAVLDYFGFSQFAIDVERNPGATVSGDTRDSVGARVEEVEGIIESYSVDDYDLDAATSSLLQDLSESTGDPYFEYYDVERYANFSAESKDRVEGVGILFSEYKGRAYAADVLEGSQAEALGIQIGDVVVSIDGDSSHEWTVNEVVSAVTQAQGKNIVIGWQSGANKGETKGDYLSTKLKCTEIYEKNVSWKIVDEVGIITLQQITQTSSKQVRAAVEDMQAQGVESFVLDLRDNPGGFLTQAVDIASCFISSGTVIRIQQKSGETSKVAEEETLTDLPLVVLVNGNTAAAAEVIAGAIQDNARGTIVGTVTQGKGSIQVLRELSFGGAIRYTAGYYLTPSGNQIEGEGISPDLSVSTSEESDNQLSTAISAARELTKG